MWVPCLAAWAAAVASCEPAGSGGPSTDSTAAGSLDVVTATADADAAPGPDVAPERAACPAPGPPGTDEGSVVADFGLLDCDGTKQTLHALCGTPVILVAFTYAWCPTCIEITPEPDAIAEEHGDDVAVLQILFESAAGNPASAAACKGFVDTFEIRQHEMLIDPLKEMDIYYDHVVNESPGRVLVVDGRPMTLLHNSSEYEANHSLLHAWVAAAVATGHEPAK